MSVPMPRAVICLHGGNRYAIPLSAVRRVTEMSFVSRVPRAPPTMLGVMNTQGRVACLLDLGPLVGLKPRPARPEGKVVMLQRTKGEVDMQIFPAAQLPRLTPKTISTRGKLAKDLAVVRERGYATDLGESSPDVGTIAAPLRNVSGTIRASIGIAAPLTRLEGEALERAALSVVALCEDVNRSLA